jgi:antibiotic biosynthesis monooxygenase (ABM) superfamily enzyme
MIFYEVTLEVDREIAADYLHWLKVHMVQMLALPGFVDAQRFARTDTPEAERATFVVRYRLRDQAALDAYFANHAADMRADGLRAFGTRFSATRRVLRELN